MNNKYEKIIYKSKPIGKEKIILYLTTIDFKNETHEEIMDFINKKFLFDRNITTNDVKKYFNTKVLKNNKKVL